MKTCSTGSASSSDAAFTIPRMFPEIEFDQQGLVPCVVQDFASGEVLMLAYMSSRSLEMTLESGDLHFHSRSRDELWKKGETSGNLMHLRQLRYDCDGDSLVALVDPAGPACHTGERSCFYREVLGSASPRKDAPAADGEPFPVTYEALPALERTIRHRALQRPDGSYTVKLLDDRALIGEKVEEEAEEVVRAGREESEQRVAEEAADLLYHLSVLLASRGVSQAKVMEVLNARSS
jgi:phosphoribosyl-ATP pyrophosphohydrolase/phosphoribosyl-AMP cyclohydrolase